MLLYMTSHDLEEQMDEQRGCGVLKSLVIFGEMVNPMKRTLAVLKRFPDIEIRICLIFRITPSFCRASNAFNKRVQKLVGWWSFPPPKSLPKG